MILREDAVGSVSVDLPLSFSISSAICLATRKTSAGDGLSSSKIAVARNGGTKMLLGSFTFVRHGVTLSSPSVVAMSFRVNQVCVATSVVVRIYIAL